MGLSKSLHTPQSRYDGHSASLLTHQHLEQPNCNMSIEGILQEGYFDHHPHLALVQWNTCSWTAAQFSSLEHHLLGLRSDLGENEVNNKHALRMVFKMLLFEHTFPTVINANICFAAHYFFNQIIVLCEGLYHQENALVLMYSVCNLLSEARSFNRTS